MFCFQRYQYSRNLLKNVGNLLAKCCLRPLSLAVLMLVMSSAPQAYSKLVILGDSLSDTGNHLAALLGAPFPYYENRISNGPVAVDIIAEGLGLSARHSGHLLGNGDGSNYAVSGANAAGAEAHGLNAQWEAFLDGRQSIDHNALYLVMIGGNDVRDAAVIENTVQANQKVNAAADAIKVVLQQLIQAGAKSILVSNVPDISTIPETDERAANNPGIHLRARALSLAFNLRLAQHLAVFSSNTNIELFSFDFYTQFNQILEPTSPYGFSNLTEACFDPSPYSFHPQCDFDRFVFFDSIHPTAKVHQILGEKMLDLVRNAEDRGPILSGILYLLLE